MPNYIELGRHAAQASLDAHGERVGHTMAYDFITTQALGDDDADGDFPAWDSLAIEYRIGFLEGYWEEND
jgi:hypothetical protein